MISSKYQSINKAWREYFQKFFFKFLKTIFFSIKWLFRYSGLEFIYTKFNPPKNPQTLPTGFIWLIGIYLAFFGVASQRYDSRIDIIENRANSIFAQLAVPSVAKKVLSRIPRVQNMPCPYKPNLLNPLSVFISLFSDSKYEEVSAQLKETIEDWKDSLDSVNLSEAILRGANLREANLRGAKLQRADLRGATSREPASWEPTSREPSSRKPTSCTPTSGEPTSEEPTSGKPTSGEPASRTPTSGEPTSREPTSGMPSSRGLTSRMPSSGKPISGEPTSEEPTSGKPTLGEPKG